MDHSEVDLFDWASELLQHRAYEPAIEVFRAAVQRYSTSPRLMVGLDMALYARGLNKEAVKTLLAATDLDPTGPRCCLFLSKTYESSPSEADEISPKFKRYVALEPNNAMAQYYYAMSSWKVKRPKDDSLDFQEIEPLLKKAIALNGSIPGAHMQLGNLYADQHQFERSIPEYARALELNPNLPDPHYCLGTDYIHMGQKDRAQTEFAIYQKPRAQHLKEVDKEGDELQQFIYSPKTAASSPKP